MLTYMCKYAPIEILEAFGTPVIMMEPQAANFTLADTEMHPNMCSFVKAILEEFAVSNFEGMLLTSCCDSSRRLYDTLCRTYPDKFFFCMDLPRKLNSFTVSLYANQIQELIAAYTEFCEKQFAGGTTGRAAPKTFCQEKLEELCRTELEMRRRHEEMMREGLLPGAEGDLSICLAGARPGSEIKHLIQNHGVRIALDLTCTGVCREFELDSEDVIGSYARALLSQLPCMRMNGADGRWKTLSEMQDNLDGIIYHTVKFCDIYSYEYTHLRELGELPMVKMETDATRQGSGQILTRVEAFLESLREQKKAERAQEAGNEVLCGELAAESGAAFPAAGTARGPGEQTAGPASGYDAEQDSLPGPKSGNAGNPVSRKETQTAAGKRGKSRHAGKQDLQEEKTMDRKHPSDAGRNPDGTARRDPSEAVGGKEARPVYVLGIDSGSTSTNAVILNDRKEICAFAVVRTGAKSGESAKRVLEQVLEQAGLSRADLATVVSTGYGRVSIPFADRNITEISCHGKGAHFLNPKVRTILDIGGQDSKAIRLNDQGGVVDFVMNDKCAAGTGRFLEMMARTLEISIDELGPLSLQSKERVEISSMCSVFAESEVISLIAQNKEPADIACGIHRAIAGKALSLLARVGAQPEYMMTGGVAKNPGMVRVLEEQLGTKLFIYEEPEIVGALGAALFGLESGPGREGRF